MSGLKKSQLLFGLLYGIGLSIFGFFSAGSGHGTYVLLGLASSVFAAVGILAAFLAPPFLWAWIWSLMQTKRKLFVIAVTAHYAGAVAVLMMSQMGDWEYLLGMWQDHYFLIASGFLWYLGGQVVMWGSFFRAMKTQS
jgi:hypothetical protein